MKIIGQWLEDPGMAPQIPIDGLTDGGHISDGGH